MTSPQERAPGVTQGSHKIPTTSQTPSKSTRKLPTQRERILALLQSEEAVCGTTLLASAMPRYASVIHKLRSDGWYIVTRPCTRFWHNHRTPQVEYAMVADDER